MEIFVGTSGWSNPIWNPNGLDWYQKHSGLNCVELSMSFFQLPTKMQIDDWAKGGSNLAWSVKVNRSVTHLFRFNQIAKDHFLRFRELFLPLDHLISFYVFQLPPNAHPSMRSELETFLLETGLTSRIALEWRNHKWFNQEHIDWANRLGITLVSADSPAVPRDIMAVNHNVYLRLHGRSDWFLHHYSRKELAHIANEIRATKCKRLFAYLDNEGSQLKNARAFLAILKDSEAALAARKITGECE